MTSGIDQRQTCQPATHRPGTIAALLALAIGCAVMTGCSFISEFSMDTQLFRQNIVAATEAIQRGDLEQAEVHLADARPLAQTPEQQRKVRSLESLIAGAEAMMQGDGLTASAYWSRIEDPYLRRQVRRQARSIGIQVPISPVASAGGAQ